MGHTGSDGVRVVVADDEADLRELLRLQLEIEGGFEVVGFAGTGADALEMCRRLKPHAVVMDVLMPDMTGIEAIEQLWLEMPQVGVVAYSAIAEDVMREEIARLGVQLITKTGEAGPIVNAVRVSIDQAVSRIERRANPPA